MIRLDDPSGCHQVGRVAKRDPNPTPVFASCALAFAMLAAAVLVVVVL